MSVGLQQLQQLQQLKAYSQMDSKQRGGGDGKQSAFDFSISFGAKSILGGRTSQEDEFTEFLDLNKFMPSKFRDTMDMTIRRRYCAVFDGHLGPRCARFCKENLHRNLARDEAFADDVELALRNAFAKTERDWFTFACENKHDDEDDENDTKRKKKKYRPDGCCACVLLIVGDVAYCANVGDCRAVLLRSKTDQKALSRDHKPTDPEERKRIEAAGGSVDVKTRTYRAWGCCGPEQTVLVGAARVIPGHISVARTIGTISCKHPPFGGIEGVLSAEPEISRSVITKDDFGVVMGSDGIWNYVQNKDAWGPVHDAVFSRAPKEGPGRGARAADGVVTLAFKKAVRNGLIESIDNMTALVLIFTPSRSDADPTQT